MHTNPNIFKAYDIRGVYGTDLTDDTAYGLGRAYGQFLKQEYPNQPDLTVIVARDMRESGVSLESKLKQGLSDENIKIINIGVSSTPMMYYAVLEYGVAGGIIITASHNPAEYNGFKLVKHNAIPISGDKGIYQMRDIVVNNTLEAKNLPILETIKANTLQDYIQDILNYHSKEIEIKPLKVVVDTANGMGYPAIKAFLDNFPQLEVLYLYSELDGTFPNHEANPLKEETLLDLQNKIRELGADFGIAGDGDFDRVSFVDNTGKTIRPDITTALLAQLLLNGREGSKILYDLRSSNITPEEITRQGGVPMQTRVGHSFIKAQMREEKAFFAGEFSGHFYLDMIKGREHAYFENPLFVILKILELLSENEISLNELTKDLFIYSHSGEINFEIERPKDEILAEIKQEFSQGKLNELDGIRIDYSDFWFSVRASNTEPVLRLIVEGKTESIMEDIKAKLISVITR
jgi:phosphomannomutase